jgi:8-oxo-dGTP pyrophosphatase MutT (NUDIX family)
MFTDAYPDRHSIRAILFDTEGKLVFLGLRQPGREVFYMTFGGGVEADETAEVTLERELLEELDATAAIGREVFAVPAHRYHVAVITHEGEHPFTLGPEFNEGRDETYEIKRVTFEEATADDFDLQPELLKPFLKLYERILLQEVELLSLERNKDWSVEPATHD